MCSVQIYSLQATIRRPLKQARVGIIGSRDEEKRPGQNVLVQRVDICQRSYLSICNSIPATYGSKNKMNVACTAVVDDRFDKLHFFNKVATQILSHNWEERSIHGLRWAGHHGCNP
jgi:hypothetical protein